MRQNSAILFAVGGAALDMATPASGIENSWMPALETPINGANDAQVALGFSPMPTQPAALFGRMLLPRVDLTMGPATCGYVTTESNSFTCITNGATCTAQGGYVGCCETNSACTAIKTTCINYSRSSAGACNLPSDYHTLCCATSTLAECYTYIVTTSAKTDTDVEPYTLYACSATGGTGTLATRDPAWPTSATSGTSARETTAAPATPSSPQGSGGSNNDGGGSGSGSGHGSSSDDNSSKHSSNHVGAIVGGAVGGVAGLALLVAVGFFILRKKKSASAAAGPDSTIPQPMGPSSPDAAYANTAQPGYQYGALPPQPGAPQANYDPNMAYNSQMYQQQYPPQQQYGQYPPQPGYAAGGAAVAAAGAAELTSVTNVTPPPPSVSPGSPELYDASSTVGIAQHPQHPQSQPYPPHSHPDGPSELAAVVPLGAENNRAELPSN